MSERTRGVRDLALAVALALVAVLCIAVGSQSAFAQWGEVASWDACPGTVTEAKCSAGRHKTRQACTSAGETWTAASCSSRTGSEWVQAVFNENMGMVTTVGVLFLILTVVVRMFSAGKKA